MSENQISLENTIESGVKNLNIYTGLKAGLFLINTVGGVVNNAGGWVNLSENHKLAVAVLVLSAATLVTTSFNAARNRFNNG